MVLIDHFDLSGKKRPHWSQHWAPSYWLGLCNRSKIRKWLIKLKLTYFPHLVIVRLLFRVVPLLVFFVDQEVFELLQRPLSSTHAIDGSLQTITLILGVRRYIVPEICNQ